METVDDIDLDAELISGELLLPATKGSYSTYVKKFATFMNYVCPAGSNGIPGALLTDVNIAKFLVTLGKNTNYKPHHLKSAMAAFGYLNKLSGKSNIYSFQQDWPKTTQVLMIWKTKQKQNPHVPQSAGLFSPEAMIAVCGLNCSNTTELVQRLITSTSCWTSLRMEDLCFALSKNVKRVSPSLNIPRCFVIQLSTIKNDRMGTGAVDNRTFVVPCVCSTTHLEGSEAKKFSRDCIKNINHDCAGPCPFAVIGDYLQHIPDPYGELREGQRSANPTLAPLRFVRARATIGDRIFTKGPYGINSIRKANAA